MTRAKTSFVKAGLVGLALCSSAAAFAQDNLPPPITGCLPTAEMMARLKAEGQRSVIVGNRVTKVDGEYAMNVITMNEDGSRGYNIEADAAIGQPAKEFCVRTSFVVASLRDVQDRSIPGGLANVRSIRIGFENGQGLMMTALAGSRGNVPLTVFADKSTDDGSLSIVRADGDLQPLAIMVDVSYTPYAIERLKRSQQMASASGTVPSLNR